MKTRFLHTLRERAACVVGRHDMRQYRHLTRDSREWRCTRPTCAHRVADVQEADIPWMLRGANPWGGADGIGQTLADHGARDGVDQGVLDTFGAVR